MSQLDRVWDGVLDGAAFSDRAAPSSAPVLRGIDGAFSGGAARAATFAAPPQLSIDEAAA